MKQKKAFIYVGHSNWGKSFALKILTDNNPNKKTTTINNCRFWVRKMSNDDDGKGLLSFARTQVPTTPFNYFILAFCPNHLTDKTAMDILIELQKHCKLYFFIQDTKYTRPHNVISQDKINSLSALGTVQILNGIQENTVRASEFRAFITEHTP